MESEDCLSKTQVRSYSTVVHNYIFVGAVHLFEDFYWYILSLVI